MSPYRADCSQCCGLCCVVDAQFTLQGFGRSKPAATPCLHLDAKQRCAIHRRRRLEGYAACESFDCYGAGQFVTQRLFGGASWSDSPECAAQMFAAYRQWLPRFEAAAMIEAALPFMEEGARAPFHALMQVLVSERIAGGSVFKDGPRLRADLRAALQAAVAPSQRPKHLRAVVLTVREASRMIKPVP